MSQFIGMKFPACRKGWLGAWDAVVAAVSGRDRLTADVDIEVRAEFANGNLTEVKIIRSSDYAAGYEIVRKKQKP